MGGLVTTFLAEPRGVASNPFLTRSVQQIDDFMEQGSKLDLVIEAGFPDISRTFTGADTTTPLLCA